MNGQINKDELSQESNSDNVDLSSIDDIDVSNKGQRIVIILVAIIILAAAGFGFMVFSRKQSEKAKIDNLKKDFITVNANGYKLFWKKAQIDLKVMKSNADFQAKLKEYLNVSSVSYAKHIKKEAIPVLETAIPKYKALESYGVAIPELKALTFALESLISSWQEFSDEVVLYEGYLKNKSKLDALGGQWMAAQQNPKDDKSRSDAAKYVKIINCILGDKKIADYDPWNLSLRVADTCAKVDHQPQWFKKVAFSCLDYANQPVEADDIYTATVEKYNKIELDNQDTKSVFAVKNCLKLSRDSFEAALSDKIAAGWTDYVKKKLAFINAIKQAKENI